MREPLNRRLIRIVTSQYSELQGLKTIANAALPLGYAAVLTLARSNWDVLLALPLFLAGLWFRFTWVRDHIEHFYESHCGRVADRPQGLGHAFLFMQGLCVGGSLTDWPVADGVFLALSFTLYPAFAVVRDAPYRLHWIVPFLVGAGAALQHLTLTSAQQIDVWTREVAFFGGLAMALAGALDHYLLVRTLRPGTLPRTPPDTVPDAA